ncbi:MAG TPA: type I-C CRISPR-associated protein Cas8c/Csd1, partial [Methanoregulaceae archaeon]|nr:type I-C CRISPR-associated protein Cas8c/Csd1 [Methanoregulaceae archaeon]
MILQSLCSVYDVLADEDAMAPAPYGFSRVGVSFALVISPDGVLTNIVDLRSGESRHPQLQEHLVPLQKKRQGTAPVPYFLCDKAEYVFGIQRVKAKDRGSRSSKKGRDDTILIEDEKGLVVVSRRSRESFSAFRSLQHALLDNCDEPAVRAFLAFLDSWDPEQALDHPKVREYLDDLLSGGRCVVRVGDAYLHGIPEVQQIWKASLSCESEKSHTAQCLISGSVAPISRTHQAIKGVTGANQSGASLVSFNEQAFCSYGKEQSYNAPVSVECEFKYTTALNQLIASPDHRIRIGDATTVFWAQTGDRSTEAIIAALLDPPDDDAGEAAAGETETVPEPGKQVIDDRELTRIRDVLRLVRQGAGIRQGDLGINPETRCFILGLAPNNARLAVRYWHQDSFGNLVTNLAR